MTVLETMIDREMARRVIDPPLSQKQRARRYTAAQIAAGLIEKEPCRICGAVGNVHHTDYWNPDEIVWLCRLHHAGEHGRLHRIRYPNGNPHGSHRTPASTAFLQEEIWSIPAIYRVLDWLNEMGVRNRFPREL